MSVKARSIPIKDGSTSSVSAKRKGSGAGTQHVTFTTPDGGVVTKRYSNKKTVGSL
jgi:hypothetical protein